MASAPSDKDGVLGPEARAALAHLDTPGWHDDPALVETVRAPLLAAAAAYFLEARDRRGQVADSVARFHLGNGARLERLDMLGDTSAKGLEQSYGLMVNYLYDPRTIERNHEAYAERDEVVAAAAVRRLLPNGHKPPRRQTEASRRRAAAQLIAAARTSQSQ